MLNSVEQKDIKEIENKYYMMPIIKYINSLFPIDMKEQRTF